MAGPQLARTLLGALSQAWLGPIWDAQPVFAYRCWASAWPAPKRAPGAAGHCTKGPLGHCPGWDSQRTPQMEQGQEARLWLPPSPQEPAAACCAPPQGYQGKSRRWAQQSHHCYSSRVGAASPWTPHCLRHTYQGSARGMESFQGPSWLPTPGRTCLLASRWRSCGCPAQVELPPIPLAL